MHTIELIDSTANTRAKILTSFGFNCYSFQAILKGRPVELLWSVPNFESGTRTAVSQRHSDSVPISRPHCRHDVPLQGRSIR